MSLQEGERRIAGALYDGIRKLSVRGSTYAQDAADTVHILATGTAGGVSVLAQFLVKENASAQDVDNAYRFALLLIGRMTTRFNKTEIEIPYQITAVRDALSDFEKLYGHKADGSLLPTLVSAANDKEALEHADVVAKAIAAGSVIDLRDYTKH